MRQRTVQIVIHIDTSQPAAAGRDVRRTEPPVTPVVVLRHDGRQWLVSPFGETQWVRNVRANGVARLGRGRRLQPVTLQEVTDQRRPVVLQRYRRAFRIVPFVRGAFDGDPSNLDDFAREADRYPVFLISRETPAG